MSFDITRRIRFADVDPAGIVFYPRYFEMINAVIEDWFEQGVGYGFDAMILKGPHGVPLAHMEAEFKAPSRLDDTLVFSLVVRDLGRASIRLTLTARCGEEVRMVARPTLVFIDQTAHKPVSIPEALRARMLGYREAA
ncbi:acyl-CoA thioesterase [Maricaulis maris]|uniref:4-hydroxybenzoyl-CoA thioesterase n=1 Tax=Maricaulis maris TaxID=74318 RepID=A0A495DLF4_9PROT|nr:thioesterase family protein [Maricaulis maris]RKR03763.1 4-hydroxybenzoyl-CoA thioesterase [Maricaulis maris]